MSRSEFPLRHITAASCCEVRALPARLSLQVRQGLCRAHGRPQQRGELRRQVWALDVGDIYLSAGRCHRAEWGDDCDAGEDATPAKPLQEHASVVFTGDSTATLAMEPISKSPVTLLRSIGPGFP